MFLNPWYGQVGGAGASEGARVHTVEGATATGTAAATAVSAVGGDDDDDRVLSTTTDVNAQQGDNTIKAPLDMGAESTAAVAASMNDTATPVNRFEMIQQRLKSGWTAHVSQDGRLFYCK